MKNFAKLRKIISFSVTLVTVISVTFFVTSWLWAAEFEGPSQAPPGGNTKGYIQNIDLSVPNPPVQDADISINGDIRSELLKINGSARICDLVVADPTECSSGVGLNLGGDFAASWDDVCNFCSASGGLWLAVVPADPNSDIYRQNGKVLIGRTSSAGTEPAASAILQVGSTKDGGNRIAVINTSSGSGAFSDIIAYNGAGAMRLGAMGQNYPTSGGYFSNSGVIEANSGLAGGLSVIAGHTSGVIRFYSGGSADTNKRMQITSDGKVYIGQDYSLTLQQLEVSTNDKTYGIYSTNNYSYGIGVGASSLVGLYGYSAINDPSLSRGVIGISTYGRGIEGQTTSGHAGYFIGDVAVMSGDLAVGKARADSDLKLDVEGKIGADFYCDSAGGNCKSIASLGDTFWTGSLAGNINNANTGYVGIGTAAPAASLHVAGYDSIFGSERKYSRSNTIATTNEIVAVIDTTGWVLYSGASLKIESMSNNYAVSHAGLLTGYFFFSYLASPQIAWTSYGAGNNDIFTVRNMGNGTYQIWLKATSQHDALIKVSYRENVANAVSFASFGAAGSGGLSDVASTINYIFNNNVGIGVTNPSFKLHVANRFDPYCASPPCRKFISSFNQNESNQNSGPQILIGYMTDATTETAGYIQSGNSFPLIMGTTGATQAFTILNTGNVGIGTASPGAKLEVDVNSSFLYNNALILKNTYDSNLGVALGFSDNAGSLAMIGATSDGVGGQLDFGTHNGTFVETHLTIKNDGNVGIGVTNPIAKLHLNKSGIGASQTAIRLVAQHDDDTIAVSTRGIIAQVVNNDTDSGNITDGGFFQATTRGGEAHGIYSSAVVQAGYTGTAYAAYFDQGNIYAGGNVGIGRTNPEAKLDIDNGTAFSPLSNVSSALKLRGYYGGGLIFQDTAYAGIWSVDNGQTLAFGSNGTSGGFGSLYGQMVLKNGNLGIGVTNPVSAKLEVAGQVKITGGSPGAGRYLTSDAAGLASWTTPTGGLPSGTAGQTLRHDGTNWVANSNLYNSGGNVGIGTASPGYDLEVDKNGAAQESAIAIDANGNQQSALYFLKDNGAKWALYSPGGSEDLRLWDGAADRVTFQDGGNVGIGVTTPDATLVVKGNGTGSIKMGDPTYANYGAISLNGSLATGNYNFTSSPGDQTLYINRPTGNNILFREGNVTAPQVTIATGGNVGIGVTSPGAKLQINPPALTEGLKIILPSANAYSPINIQNSAAADIFRVDQSGILQVGQIPWARLTTFPAACPAGQYVTAVGGSLTCATPAGGIANAFAKIANLAGTVQFTASGEDTFRAAASGGLGISFDANKTINYSITDLGVTNAKIANLGVTNAKISEMDWTKLQNYPSACPAGQFVTTIGDTLTCATPAGGLPSGTAGQTLRHNGTSWINVSNLYNDGTNIGIGTTNPNKQLHIKTASGNAEIDLQSASSQHWGIYQDDTTDDLRFWNVNDLVTFTDEGNVGIGVSPSTNAKLDVAGKIKITDGSQGLNKVLTSDADGLASWTTSQWSDLTTYFPGIKYDGGAVAINNLRVNIQQRMTELDRSTKLIVGHNSDSLVDPNGLPHSSFIELDSPDSNAAGIRINNSGSSYFLIYRKPIAGQNILSIAVDNSIVGQDHDFGTFVDMLTFDATMKKVAFPSTGITVAGNVGIGTTAPNKQLHIKTASGNAEIDIQSASSPYWGIYQDDTTNDLRFWNVNDLVTFTNEGNINVAAGGAYSYNGVKLAYGDTTNANFFFGNAGNSTMTGYDNTVIGSGALSSNTTGYYNTANGFRALYSNTTGYSNTANGTDAIENNTTGLLNTANGAFALKANTTGSYNTANGGGALQTNTTGDNNTANGLNALQDNTDGSGNTANGMAALLANTTGNSNTADGVYALSSNTIGSRNVAIGNLAGSNNITGSYNIFIGYNTIAPSEGTFNFLNIGNAIYGNLSNGNIGIGTTDPGADKLDVRGRAYASGGWQTTDADYAEWFEKEENTQVGDLIGIDLKTGKVRKYRTGDKFLGIHSAGGSVVGNRLKETEEEMNKNYTLVGLIGQLDFNRLQVDFIGRIVKTKDGQEIGILLANGKILIGR